MNGSPTPSLFHLINKLTAEPISLEEYSWKDEVLHCKDRVVLSQTSTLKTHILEELHSSLIIGNLGFWNTYAWENLSLFWTSMKNDILTFAVECNVCQFNKGEMTKLSGTLQPSPFLSSIWTNVSRDFITSLQNLGNKSNIMVVVDRISKYAHFFMLPHLVTPTLVAQIFME